MEIINDEKHQTVVLLGMVLSPATGEQTTKIPLSYTTLPYSNKSNTSHFLFYYVIVSILLLIAETLQAHADDEVVLSVWLPGAAGNFLASARALPDTDS